MRIGYLECFAGISGDMLMAGLVDAGAPIALLERTVASLSVGAELRLTRVNRSGIASTKVDVIAPAEPPNKHRHLPEIRRLLTQADLTDRARELSLKAFALLAQAEGRIHGVPEEKVHFHEVGAVDAICDIACCAAAADALHVDAWYGSPVNVGSGFVNCAHGTFPVPAPATAELLKGVPTYSAHAQMELVTPTGAALLRALDCRFDAAPVMKTQSVGYGAGNRNPERFPNVLRVSLGEVGSSFHQDKVTVLECAVDDLSPQVLAHTAQSLLEHGALDVLSAAVTMKKGRLGTLLTVLCKPEDAGPLQQLLFRETTTLGIRVREENRVILARETTPVETEYGVIHIKTGLWQGEEWNAAPEFEDCRRAADASGVPLKTVMQAAMVAWRNGVGARS